jgi:L-iditol 2-dehydrogenase
MKQIVLTALERLEPRETPTPSIRNDMDVLIRVGAVGVCGSDVHYYSTGRIGDQIVTFPFPLGHETSGTVVEVGRAVRRVKPGDRVAVDPAVPCGVCDQCRAGRRHTCRKLLFLGCPDQLDGCLGEYLIMPEGSCYPVDTATISLEAAAFVEPLSIGVWSTVLAGQLAGKSVGILGFGPIGASVLVAALASRPRRVYVSDKIETRLHIARRAGAGWTGNPDTMDLVGAIRAEEPGRLDVVFECCGQQEALDQAVEILGPGGKLILVGIPEVERVSFMPDRIRRAELTIQNVRRQNECVGKAIDLLPTVDLDLLVTHRFPLDRTPEAFEIVKGYRDGVMKAMIRI